MNIAIVNGPNLNLLGMREPEVYGSESFEKYLDSLKQQFPEVVFSYFQSNIEGELVTAVQEFGVFGKAEGIIINAGGYSHTSVAVADAVKASRVPVVDVHISNIYAREAQRHQDLLAAYSDAMVCGMGLEGYKMAVLYLLGKSKAQS